MIKAILSDGGNILFSDREAKRAPYERIKAHMENLTYTKFKWGFAPYKIMAQTLPDYSTDDALKDYLTAMGCPEVFSRLSPAPKKKLELFPEVKETLKALDQKGIPFIILTDASKKGDELKPALVRWGIEAYVADVISSKDVGVIKPDERFFGFALQKHGLKKEEVIFLAHDDDELQGAHELGFVVYAFNCEASQDLSYLPEERKLESFNQLEGIVVKE